MVLQPHHLLVFLAQAVVWHGKKGVFAVCAHGCQAERSVVWPLMVASPAAADALFFASVDRVQPRRALVSWVTNALAHRYCRPTHLADADCLSMTVLPHQYRAAVPSSYPTITAI
jgi:hypothetical protein